MADADAVLGHDAQAAVKLRKVLAEQEAAYHIERRLRLLVTEPQQDDASVFAGWVRPYVTEPDAKGDQQPALDLTRLEQLRIRRSGMSSSATVSAS